MKRADFNEPDFIEVFRRKFGWFGQLVRLGYIDVTGLKRTWFMVDRGDRYTGNEQLVKVVSQDKAIELIRGLHK